MSETFGMLNWSALPGLLLLPLAWVFLRWSNFVRERRLARLSFSAPIRTSASLVSKLLIIFVILLSLLRPYIGFEEYNLDYQKRDVLLIVDVSKSMLARDVLPNRLQMAKRKAAAFLDYIEERGFGESVGIVAFAGQAYTYCPLTEDYSVLRVYLDSLDPSLISSEGTSITAALRVALQSLDRQSADPALLVLMTDGEDPDLNASAAVYTLKYYKVSLAVLGIGTVAGSRIPINDSGYLRNQQGEEVLSRLSLANLQQLAEKSGGKFILLRPQQDEAEILAGRNGPAAGYRKSENGEYKIRTYKEFGAQLLFIPLLLLLIMACRSKILLVLLLAFFPHHSQAEESSGKAELHAAYLAYQAGDFEKALTLFEREYQNGDRSIKIVNALASSHYKTGDYIRAERLFSEVAELSENREELFSGLYNQGTSLLMAGRYQQAVLQLEEALKIKPQDQAARHNLELARRAAAESQEEESENSGQGDPENDPETGSTDKDRQDRKQGADSSELRRNKAHENSSSQARASGQSRSDLSREQAEAWLDSISDEPIILRQHVGRGGGERRQKW